jgi:hypothetical protein
MVNNRTSMWRYELKYVVGNYSDCEINNMIIKHPAKFSAIYEERKINNIYYDTVRYDAFSDNVIGVSDRLKIRIRWYGMTFTYICNPVLEIKIKNSSVGRKELYKLLPFKLNKGYNPSDLLSVAKKNEMSILAKRAVLITRPVLINSYMRSYYISNCRRFRLTYDYDLGFYGFRNEIYKKVISHNRILEIKFNKAHIAFAKNISAHFPFQISKNSKYVNGINELQMLPYSY